MRDFTHNIFFLVTICILNSCTSLSYSKTNGQKVDNYLIIDHLSDYEEETRFKWKDLMGKETKLDMDEQRYANSSLKTTALWQITDGHTFAQLIFNGKSLMDCEFLKDGGEIVDDFIDNLIDENHFLRHGRNAEFGSVKHHKYHESSNNILNLKSNVTIIILKRLQQIPEHFLELMNLKKLQEKCNKLHKQIKQQLQNEDDGDIASDSDTETAIGRSKRQIENKTTGSQNWLIAPDTLWCGSGNAAKKYSEIGPSKADVCCRKHDHCRASISSLGRKWGLYNLRPFTISHCKCDSRFKTCLKMANGGDANLVGKLFFNVVQIKCFVLKQEQECKMYSWWGKCLKFKKVKKAYLRNNQKY